MVLVLLLHGSSPFPGRLSCLLARVRGSRTLYERDVFRASADGGRDPGLLWRRGEAYSDPGVRS